MPAPNRTLDLKELERPRFRRVLAELEAVRREVPGSYLHPSKRWEYPWALERAQLSPGDRVLDAGCGASVFPVFLARSGFRTAGLDLTEPGPPGGRSLGVGYVRGDLGRLPFAERSFDALFCISVIEHLPEDGATAALAELARVLRPGGRLLLTTDFYADAEAELWYRGPDGRFPVRWNVFDESRLRRTIDAAPGLRLSGELELDVDWEMVRPRMRRFHGYPYTSVGVTLVRETADGPDGSPPPRPEDS